MIPKQANAVFYHPLDDLDEWTTQQAWSGSLPLGIGQIGTGGGNGTSLVGFGGSGYPAVSGASRVAFMAWVRNPSPATTLPPTTTPVPTTTTPVPTTTTLPPTTTQVTAQEAWDSLDPALLDAMVWEAPGGSVQTGYPNWDPAMQATLRSAFDRAWEGQPSLIAVDPVANLASNAAEDDTSCSQYISAADATDLFTEYAGNTLAVEAGGRVPWSISGYSPTELATLLDSRQMFIWYAGGTPAPASYRIRHLITTEDTRGWSTPATAEHAWGFMQDKIGASRIETIGSVLEWFRGAVHFSGSHRYGNCDDHWQYRGYVPAIRVIEGTTKTSTGSFRHYTAGCHGTYGFLRSVLRSVNIPVGQYAESGFGHSLPHFLVDDVYMSHGDDPYNAYCRYDDYPGTALLVDAATFATWFPNPTDHYYSVGRQVRVCAIQYLPLYLLKNSSSGGSSGNYCYDIGQGLSHEDGTVNAYLKFWAASELEAMGLWADMDAKLALLGGCGAI